MREVSVTGADPTPKKRTIFAEFKGMTWWQVVLAVIPLGLIGVGGAIGGLIGALALLANIKIAKAGMNAAVKGLVMIGVDVLAAGVWYVVASAIVDTMR